MILYYSPCVSLCQLNEAQTYCLGCKRSIDEIVRWMEFSNEQRKKISEELEDREIEGV